MDPVINFGKVTIPLGYALADVSIALTAGDGARFPNPAVVGAFNVVWWNTTDYPDPSDDPSREIVRVTANVADVLTITRAQEGTTATDKNLGGKVYKMALVPTKKTIDDIETAIAGKEPTITAGASTQFWRGDKAWATLNQAAVAGLTVLSTVTFAGLLLSGLTASQLVATDASKNLQSLSVVTYPSLTEISHVKGANSNIQSQIDAKQATLANGSGTTINSNQVDLGGELTSNANIGLGSDAYIFSISSSVATTNYFSLDATSGKLIGILGISETNFTIDQTSNRLILNTTGGINFVDTTLAGASNGYVWTLADQATGTGSWAAVFTLPSLTSGSVLFSNGTTIVQDNANFFYDDTNNRLGIGTATPGSLLDIGKTTNAYAGTDSMFKISGNFDSIGGVSLLEITGDNPFSLKTKYGVNILSFNAGLGALEVGAGLYLSTPEIRNSGRIYTDYLTGFDWNGGRIDFDISTEAFKFTDSHNRGVLLYGLSASATTHQRLAYDSSNYVDTTVGSTGGITYKSTGSNPKHQFEFSTGAGYFKTFLSGSNVYFQAVPSGGATVFDSYGADLYLGVSSGLGVIIDTSNNVGVGIAAPTAKLHVFGSTDTKQLLVKGHSTQTSNLVEFQRSTTTDPVLAVANDGSTYFRNRVSGSDGQVYITTGVNPSVSIRGDSTNGYYPELNFYMAGILTGWITGYNGITLNAASGYSVGSTSVYQGTTPFNVKSGYAGVHTVPMFEVRGYQGENDPFRIWQDGRVNQYGAGASLNWPIARRTGLAASATGTGGTLPTNTYYYKITACNFANETIGSVEASVSITLGQNASLSWDYSPQEGVDHYRIYRSTSSGSYGASTRIDTTLHGAAGVPYYITTFSDTGYTPTSGTPPTSVTHDIMTYRKWEGGTGKFMDFEDYDGTTITSVNHDGSITLGSRILQKQGVDVASANDLTLGLDGNAYEITGTTQINAITTASWQNGCRITFLFTSNPTVKHNTAGGGGTAVILLAGAADFVASAGDTLTLVLSEIGGTQAWRETSRTVI